MTPTHLFATKPRRPYLSAGDLADHVLNRRVGRLPLVETRADPVAFEKIVADAHAHSRIRIAAYCLMPNHWHLLLWPRQDGEPSEVLRWITVTHTQRWHTHHHTAGTGPCIKAASGPFPFRRMNMFSWSRAMWSGMPCGRDWSGTPNTGSGQACGDERRETCD